MHWIDEEFMTPVIKDKAITATERYLEHRGYTNIQRVENNVFMFEDDEDVVLSFTFVTKRDKRITQKEADAFILDHLDILGDREAHIRFDQIRITPVADNNRALIMHIHDVLNTRN